MLLLIANLPPPASPPHKNTQERYERHHHVVYSSDALAAAVHLSSRYITDRFLPDKVREWVVGRANLCREACLHTTLSNRLASPSITPQPPSCGPHLPGH